MKDHQVRAMAPKISDLIADSKLEVMCFKDCTIQTGLVLNSATGQRGTIERERWERTKELGRGSFGVVFLEKCTEGSRSGEVRAVKELVKGTASVFDAFGRELEAIAKFSHEGYRNWFVRSFGWYEDSDAVFINMEYLNLGDLEGYIKSPLSQPIARQISEQLLEGLGYMHENNFVHRDLKPGGHEWWVKITDFGITKRVDGTELRTIVGTEAYLAPEVRGLYTPDSRPDDEETYSFAVDIWAVGAISCRMITGQLPFPPGRKLFDYVVGGKPFPVEYTQSMGQDSLSSPWIRTNQPISNESNLHLLTRTNHTSNDEKTILPLASAQWTEQLAILRLQNHVPSPGIVNDSSRDAVSVQKPRFFRFFQDLNTGDDVIWITFSPEGQLLSCSFEDTGKYVGKIRIWADKRGEGGFENVQQVISKYATTLAASSYDAQIFAVCGDERIQIWAYKRLDLVPIQILDCGTEVTSIAFSPNGRKMASGHSLDQNSNAPSRTMRIWLANREGKFEQTQELKGLNYSMPVAFSPDGQRLVSFNQEGPYSADMYIWADIGDKFELMQKLEGGCHKFPIAFSPDGERLASNYTSCNIRISADKNGRLHGKLTQTQELQGNGYRIGSLAFSSDGKRLAWSSYPSDGLTKNGIIRVWEIMQGKFEELQQLEYPSDDNIANAVAFSKDGNFLASGEKSGMIKIWKLEA